jgi:hypothetical protein
MAKKEELLKELAAVNTAATFQTLALIGALAERHLIDPAKVAEWAEFFANEMENSAGDYPANLEHLRTVAARLRSFARKLVEVVKPPENPDSSNSRGGCLETHHRNRFSKSR